MKIILSKFFKESLLLNKKKYNNIFFERKYNKKSKKNKNSKIIKKNISIKNFIKYKKLHYYKSFIKKDYKKKISIWIVI